MPTQAPLTQALRHLELHLLCRVVFHHDPCLSPGGTALAKWETLRFWLLEVLVAGVEGDWQVCKAFPVLLNFLSFLQFQSRNEIGNKGL